MPEHTDHNRELRILYNQALRAIAFGSVKSMRSWLVTNVGDEYMYCDHLESLQVSIAREAIVIGQKIEKEAWERLTSRVAA